jgi:hypothetical protein
MKPALLNPSLQLVDSPAGNRDNIRIYTDPVDISSAEVLK